MSLKDYLLSELKSYSEKADQKICLSPTENFADRGTSNPDYLDKITNLYVPEMSRGKQDKLIFSGRTELTNSIQLIYQEWMQKLNAKAITMKPLSGLHSHTLLALAFRNKFKKVLLVSESGGGHYLTENLFSNLGYEVMTMPVDYDNHEIDLDKTCELLKNNNFDMIFVDQSESLNYMDFSPIFKFTDAYTIFDASHYLSNIIVGDYKNPFDMGFDLCLGTMHKNFPGPQKAFMASRELNEQWEIITRAISMHVSSFHFADIFKAGMLISDETALKHNARLYMENAISLEKALKKNGIPVVERRNDQPSSYFIFLNINDQDIAFEKYNQLLDGNIETNYRLLPYSLGYGIRIGTMPMTLRGMLPQDTENLANIISSIYLDGATDHSSQAIRDFLCQIDKRKEI